MLRDSAQSRIVTAESIPASRFAMNNERVQISGSKLTSIRSKGYTLIELITVIAITAVLLSIIVFPVFTGFNSTRTAQAFSDAQSRARQITEVLAKDISNASVVRDPNGIGGLVNVEVPVPRAGRDEGNIPVAPVNAGAQVRVGLPFSKLDMFLPAAGDPTKLRGGYVNPGIGKTDPTLGGPKGQVVLPVAPGTTLKRVWVGLRDPLRNHTTVC
jgi:prepilin-type N-terminal cleavage/methylation domain-containing protein